MKPTLHQITGKNRYCGPSAVSAITGVTTDHAAALMRAWSGRRAIRGASVWELTAALQQLGCTTTGSGRQLANTKPAERPTLAAWLRDHQRPAGKHVIVIFRNHYGVLLGRRYICAQSRGVTSLADIPGRRGRVLGWMVVSSLPKQPPAAPTVTRVHNAESSALAKARRLAKKHGVELERDNGGYWVTHPDFDDTDEDPRQGEHFCVGGYEVLDAVEAYVKVGATARPSPTI